MSKDYLKMSNSATDRKNTMTICISSGKGGVGKTSIAINLAIALSGSGARVLLLDGDLGLANVDVMLGLTVSKTIRDILEEELPPSGATIEVSKNFYVLPATSGVPEMARMNPNDQAILRDIINRIAQDFDYLIIDASAGIGPSVTWFNSMADMNMVILTPDPASITDAYALMKVLSTKHGIKRFHLLVNMIKNSAEGKRVASGITNVTKKFLGLEPEIAGFVTASQKMSRAIMEQTPFMELYPDSKTATDIKNLASKISGQ